MATASAYDITEYAIPNIAVSPAGIVSGADGNLWFTESIGNNIGRITPAGVITEYSIATANAGSLAIARGADGNLWFAEEFGDSIGRIAPTGTISAFGLPDTYDIPFGIASGQDGNLWFTESYRDCDVFFDCSSPSSAIGRITPAGVITEFQAPSSNGSLGFITQGPDGNMWFTTSTSICSGSSPCSYENNAIGKITLDGKITEFTLSTPNSQPLGIASGADGNLWFTEETSNKIGRISPKGAITEFSLPTPNSQPSAITGGPDGNVWFTETSANQIGKISPDGVISEYPVPTAHGDPVGITTGPDGNIWFTESSGQIGRISLNGGVNLNQHGLTGTWYNPGTSGQGLLIQTYPDLLGAGQGVLAAGWYTFDITAAGGQRWYTLQGSATSGDASAALGIFTATGGNFDAAPPIEATQVGSATLSFSDCTHGVLNYSFADGSGRSGTIPLTRLDANETCSPAGDSSTATSDYLFSGAWYDKSTGGQGFFFDLSPSQTTLFASWYTYAENGAEIGGGASQRWFTIQDNAFAAGTRSKSDLPIYTTTGGTFNANGGVSVAQVGTASIIFQNCTAITLNYTFAANFLSGRSQSGTINLTRVVAAPAGCNW